MASDCTMIMMIICYLHHTVVMTAEPATSPTAPSSLLRDAVPNFTVNNSQTVQI